MNLLLKRLIDAPSATPGHCIVCGRAYPTAHHVVPRSQGGKDGPVLHLCGDGTRGCHGKAEDKRLHFRYRDAWQHIETRPMKYERALELDGWRECR